MMQGQLSSDRARSKTHKLAWQPLDDQAPYKQSMAEHNKEKLRAKTQVTSFLSASSEPNLFKKMLHANLLDIPPKVKMPKE